MEINSVCMVLQKSVRLLCFPHYNFNNILGILLDLKLYDSFNLDIYFKKAKENDRR